MIKQRNKNSTFDEWIESFRVEYEQTYLDYFSSYESGFQLLSIDYQTILKECDDRNISEAWAFSIFDIIKVKRPEENLHSPLLAELLNTNGSHGQKDSFYKLFVNRVLGQSDASNFINDNPNDYLIQSEEFIKNENDKGEIDISIRSTNRCKKFALIIENKWGSGDSCPDQIYKYYRNYTNPNGKAFADDNLRVIYLTKYGNDPCWIEDDGFRTFLQEKKGVNYFPISYVNHIRKWLEDCISNCKSSKVVYVIEQYLNFIKYGISN
jgi:hypothetical protein